MAKKAVSGNGSIRQRPDGRWEGRVSLGFDGGGKRVSKSFYGSTQVAEKIRKASAQIDEGRFIEPSKITVKQWLLDWLETFCANGLRPYTLISYRGIINHHINNYIGALKLQSVKGTHIQKMYNGLIREGFSAKTVKNVSAVAHKAFAMAVKQGMIAFNPCDAAQLPSMTQHEIKPLTDAEIPVFLEEIKGHPYENAFALCLFAGLREGECLGLSWEQVDFEKQTITICQQLQKGNKGEGYQLRPFTKSNKPRTIKPPQIAFDYLKQEQRQQAKNRLAVGPIWDNPQNLVFTNEIGKNIAIPTFYRAFKKVVTAIGRPDARPHDLRHTAATVAIASGADIKSVQSLMGHATASFTLNVYAHTSEKMMEDTAARMQAYYNSIAK